jgi:flagellar biosynthesis protein FliQ
MTSDTALQYMNQLLWNSFLIAAPLLFTILAVGLIISIMQVATQLQEMTLSYVPKLIVAIVVLMMFGPWMISRLTQFAIGLFKSIPNLG